MLIQSHAGYVHLLPALPQGWESGSFTGFCARGGFVVDLTWKHGVPVEARITSKAGAPCSVRPRPFAVRCGGTAVSVSTDRNGNGTFSTQEDESYYVVFNEGAPGEASLENK